MELKMRKMILLVLLLVLPSASWAAKAGMNIRLALGTDISAGLGYGAGVRFLRQGQDSAFEFGPDLYYASSTETTEEFHTYTENTQLTVFAVRINHLMDYRKGKPGTFFILGTGAAAINLVWEESSPTDTSLGTPCCGGGSKQNVDATGFAAILNVGMGKVLKGGRDFRLEFPILMAFGDYGNATTFIPTMTVSLGFDM